MFLNFSFLKAPSAENAFVWTHEHSATKIRVTTWVTLEARAAMRFSFCGSVQLRGSNVAVPISPATCCRIRSTLSSTEPFSVPSAGLLLNVIQPLYFVVDPQENETRMPTASFSDKMLKGKEPYNAQQYWCSTVNKAVIYQICGPLSKYSTGLKKTC